MKPPHNSEVEVHYVGKLLDGSQFDSSRDRNDTFKFKIGKGSVIKGWDEGVTTMKKGEKSLFTIKSEYAYGASGSPPKIPANATLEFEIELFGWTNKQKVTDDSGVVKEILQTGDGYNRPNDGAKVTVSYVGKTTSGTVVEEAKEESFVIGDEPSRLEGLEEGIKNMLKKEKSEFYIKSNYGYGEQGNEKKAVPPNTDLVYTVELIDFEKGKESWEMNQDEKLASGTKTKNQGNTFF